MVHYSLTEPRLHFDQSTYEQAGSPKDFAGDFYCLLEPVTLLC